MKFTTLAMIALGFAGFTVGQLETTVTTVTCINPKYCSGAGTPTRSDVYTSKTTDSTDLTRTITEHRRQPPTTATTATTCTEITSVGSDYATPISTHIQCGPDKSKPCSTSYECGCHPSAFTWTHNPETHLCWPMPTAPLFPPDFGGGRSQRWVARQAKETHAPKQTWTRSKKPPVAARATSQDFGGGRSQRLVARQTKPTSCLPGHIGTDCSTFISPPKPTHSCPPGWFGPDCPPRLWPPANPAITPTNGLKARQEPDEPHICIGDRCTIPTDIPTFTPLPTPTPLLHCPPSTCGPDCRKGYYCNKLFGRVASEDFGGRRSQRRVAREAETTKGAGEVHTTLLTLRA